MAVKFGNWQAELTRAVSQLDNEQVKKFGFQKEDSQRVKYILNENILADISWLSFYLANSTNVHLKSPDKSTQYRTDGNQHFIQQKYSPALECYTKALLHAPIVNDKSTLSLAHGNISAALYHLEHYKGSIHHIEAATSTGYPEKSLYKLVIRKANCQHGLNKPYEALKSLQEAKVLVDGNSDLDNKKKGVLLKEINKLETNFEDARNLNKNQEVVSNQQSRIPEISHGTNNVVTQASSAVKLECTKDKGRHLVATETLTAGDVLIVEKPYAAVLLPDQYDTHCHHCFGLLEAIVPCRRCSRVQYCSEVCQEQSWSSYHYIECSYLDLLHSVGIAHLSLRIILVAGLQFLLGFRKTIRELKLDGVEHVGGLSEDGHYNRDYLTVYDLMPHSEDLPVKDVYMYTMTGCLLLTILKSANWFTVTKLTCEPCCEEQVETHLIDSVSSMQVDDHSQSDSTEDVELYIGGLLVRHIQQLVCNAHAITELQVSQVADDSLVDTKSQVRVATAIYPTASLMNHSCDPTIISSFDRDVLVVRAIKDVPIGGEIFNCYGPHYRRMEVTERQDVLRSQYCFVCSCQHCIAQLKTQSFSSAFRCKKCEDYLTENGNILTCSKCGYCDGAATYHDMANKGKHLFLKGLQNLEVHDIKGAIMVLNECYSIRKSTLYKYHRDLSQTQDCLAKCYSIIGEFKQASLLLKESLTTVKVIYGDKSIEYANELQKYAEVQVNAGRLKRALKTTKEALPLFKMHYGISHKSYEELDELRKNIQEHIQLVTK